MINLGIDFGSTYSLLAVYRRNNLEDVKFGTTMGSSYIPSFVVYDTVMDEYYCGMEAKGESGKSNTKTFQSFKMLLNSEPDSAECINGGYDKEHSPEEISYIFWDNILQEALRNLGEDSIDTLVVGIPEIWGSDFNTVDGRIAVRKLFKRFPYIKNVKLVSEPAAASAFFAYNYKEMTNTDMNGMVLLIDYGGGTLDITLTQVESKNNHTAIRVIDRGGAGENFDGKIGKASILYMEALLRCALKEAGFINIDISSQDGIKAKNKLEEILQQRSTRIEKVLSRYISSPDALEELIFSEGDIFYNNSPLKITYGQMYRVYNEEISPVLDCELEKFSNMVEKQKENIKIALVGGFGNFYLVKHQVSEKFGILPDDERTSNIIKNTADCEKAIVFGAALLANNIVTIYDTFDYSLGVYSTNIENNDIFYHYGINRNDIIRYGDENIYMIKDDEGNDYVYVNISGNLDYLLINMRDDNKAAMYLQPKRQYANKLRNVIHSQEKTALIGFSIDYRGIISIHVFDYDYVHQKRTDHRKIELTTFKQMFDPKMIGVARSKK